MRRTIMAGGGNQEENPVAINVVAMVDIIFCLCLFFMCSLKFKPLDAKFESYLPKGEGVRKDAIPKTVIDEIRIVLSWNSTQDKLERLFGQNLCPTDQAGDEKLKKLIKDSYTESKSRGVPNIPLILDVGPKVPWKFVVDIFDIGRDAGVQNFQFGAGNQPDK
jgi:biopolymer transport protein ExbD